MLPLAHNFEDVIVTFNYKGFPRDINTYSLSVLLRKKKILKIPHKDF